MVDWAPECWRSVLARCADPHPFQTLEWQRAWWEIFPDGELDVWPLPDPSGSGSAPAGVAALHRDRAGVVRFAGSGELTDYPAPAIVPEGAQTAAEALLERLLASRPGWTVLEVCNAREQDGLASALRAAARARGLDTRRGADESVVVMALPARFDDYLAGLSAHHRHELRRKRTRLARELPGAALRTADATRLHADFDAFMNLHRQSPGAKGGFMSPAVEAFFRRVAHEFAALGWLRLDLLEHRGRPLAAAFGFQTPTVFYLYNMAFDPAVRSLAPGIVLISELIERAIADGLQRFDFLRGLERYKLDLGGTPERLTRLRVLAPQTS